MVLLLSSVVVLVLAALVWGGLFGLPAASRPLVAGVLLLAGLFDGIIGLRFVQRSE